MSDRIARLEICSEQLRIHLRSIPKNCAEAEAVRFRLLSMLMRLVSLKGQRECLEASLGLERTRIVSLRKIVGPAAPIG